MNGHSGVGMILKPENATAEVPALIR